MRRALSFLAGTTSLGIDTTAPYSGDWDSTTFANGIVSLTAVARDTGGKVTASVAANVTVSNAAAVASLLMLPAGGLLTDWR